MSQISEAVEQLRAGNIIAYPTETVYGLGADIFNPEAVKKVFELKGRNYDQPLLVAVSSIKEIENLAEVDDKQRKILDKFLPGPYAFILKKKVSDLITAKSDLVGIRYPDHKIALDIIQQFGPITSTSTNLSGEEAAIAADQVNLPVDYLVKGECKYKQGSTIVDLTKMNILRRGIGLKKISQFLKKMVL